MNRRIFVSLLGAQTVMGRGADFAEDYPGLSGPELAVFEKIAAGVRNASALVLYEGLPRPTWEAEKFKKELAKKKTVRIHDFHFYKEPLPVPVSGIEPLRQLSADPDTYWANIGLKLCGSYHPDYCLSWKDGKAIYDFLICFGCHEMRVYDPKLALFADIRTDVFTQFKATLQTYRRERP
jgi:hypothetical protein